MVSRIILLKITSDVLKELIHLFSAWLFPFYKVLMIVNDFNVIGISIILEFDNILWDKRSKTALLISGI